MLAVNRMILDSFMRDFVLPKGRAPSNEKLVRRVGRDWIDGRSENTAVEAV